MKKTLILSIFDNLNNPSYGGGGARVVHELVKRMTSQYSITVFTGRFVGCRDYELDEVKYKYIGSLIFGSKINQLFFHFFLIYYVITTKFDIWVESFTPPFSTSFLQLFTTKPVVALVMMLSGEDMMRKYRIPFHLIENIGLSTYKYFCIPSPFLFDKIRKHNSSAKIELISNGIDIPIEKNVQDEDEKYILFLGRIEINQKGLDLLIDAYSKIKNKEYRLVIAGGGNKSDEDSLKRLVLKSGCQNKIEIIGRVEGDQKELLYRNCTLFVLSSRFETYGLVALEAMSYGKPVVHFALDSLSWIPSGLSKSAVAFDVNSLALKIDELLDDQTLRQIMSKNAVEYSQQFSWTNVCQKYENYFDKIFSTNS